VTVGASTRTRGRPGEAEFIALIALSIALAALGIDIMLPAFPAIRAEFGLPPDSTTVGGLVTAYFLGLAIGQLVHGPLADRFGRRPTLYTGFALYGVGAVLAILAPSFSLLLLARFVWGLGAAGPRVVTVAVIRDTYDGDRMSRAMSFVMAVFLIVPVLAPTIGAGVVAVAGWRWIFGVCVAAAAVMALWAIRLPETLAPEHRLELRFGRVATAVRFVLAERRTVGYTVALTALFGAFLSYIATSELLIGDVYQRPAAFPVVFGGLAMVMGVAALANTRLLRRVRTGRLAHGVLLAYLAAAALLVLLALLGGGRPPLPVFLVGVAAMLTAHALLIPNLMSLAMEPMGAVAGTASSLVGASQIAGGALLGAALDRFYDGTVLPLALGFLGFGVVAFVAVLVAEGGQLFRTPVDPDLAPLLPPTPEA
jgi:MFS transporter, DHA1 family, multidrug resistance protein